jgi:hypothetical protein
VSPVKYELGFYIPEDDILRCHCRENLRSYILSLYCVSKLDGLSPDSHSCGPGSRPGHVKCGICGGHSDTVNHSFHQLLHNHRYHHSSNPMIGLSIRGPRSTPAKISPNFERGKRVSYRVNLAAICACPVKHFLSRRIKLTAETRKSSTDNEEWCLLGFYAVWLL